MDQHQPSGKPGEQTPVSPPPSPHYHGARLDIELEELEAAAGILDRLTPGANPLRETVREGKKTP